MIKEPHLEAALERNGFCKFSLLNTEKISLLKTLYQNYSSQIDTDGLSAGKPEVNKIISREILAVVHDDLEKTFSGYKYFSAHFVLRKSGTKSEQALHQNWNITGEKSGKAYQVLIPLNTFYPGAGGKFFVPGSHRFFQNFRSGSYGVPIVAADAITAKLVQEITLLAGDGLVYNNAVFHGSQANTTSTDSVCVIIYLLDENTTPVYLHKNAERQACEQYVITADSLFANVNQLRQGKVPTSWRPEKEIAGPEIENTVINSTALKKAFIKYWGEGAVASEIKMLHIARSSDLEEKLDRQGYAIIDFADEQKINALTDFFYQQFGTEKFEPGMLITINDMPYQRKRQIHEFFCSTLKTSFDMFFKDYVTPVSSYFTKNPSTLNSYLPMHTDSNLVLNPHLEPHYALWIPLQAVDENNGAVTVVKNSHRFPAYIAAPTIPWPFYGQENFLTEKMEVLKLKKGEAIIFDNRLVHCSRPNTTEHIRIGISIRLTHFLTPYFSFFMPEPGNNVVEVYCEPQDFYMAENWRNSDQPSVTGYKAGEIVISPYAHPLSELQEVIEA